MRTETKSGRLCLRFLLAQIAGQYPWRFFRARTGHRDADAIKDKLSPFYNGVNANRIGGDQCDLLAKPARDVHRGSAPMTVPRITVRMGPEVCV